MMKMINMCRVSIWLTASCFSFGVNAASIELFNTGVDNFGVVQPNGTTELHYEIISGPIIGSPLIRAADGVFPQSGFWLPESSSSAWIVPNFDVDGFGNLNHPSGDYTFRTTFDLSGLEAGTALIEGRWAADETSTAIFLNGVDTGNVGGGSFDAFVDFSINSGFLDGINTLDFRINNIVQPNGNPTGLRVELSGTADAIVSQVPVPTTALLFGLAGLMLFGSGRGKTGNYQLSE